MILLDTDHLSVLKYEEHPRCLTLRERMTASEDPGAEKGVGSLFRLMRSEKTPDPFFDFPAQCLAPQSAAVDQGT